MTESKIDQFLTSKNGIKFLIAILVGCYLLGTGNLDGIRQGTETFYLKIAQDMYDYESWMTPLYRGTPHWSKPPLVFWGSLPFHALLPFEHFFNARVSIIFFTLILSFFLAKEMAHQVLKASTHEEQEFVPRWIQFFFLLTSSFGFFRFGKIFMLDMALTLTSVLSYVLFFRAYFERDKKRFWWAVVLLASSILVKGPVSMVMVVGALGLFSLLYFRFFSLSFFKYTLFFSVLGLIIGSLWYLVCYLKHGQEFIDYFSSEKI